MEEIYFEVETHLFGPYLIFYYVANAFNPGRYVYVYVGWHGSRSAPPSATPESLALDSDGGGGGSGGGGRAIINNSDIPLYMRRPETGNVGNDLEGTFVDVSLPISEGISIQDYKVTMTDGQHTQINIQIDYLNGSDLYTEINAIQTVTTNCPILPSDDGCGQYLTKELYSYNDPACGPNKDDLPFVYSMDDSAPLNYKGLLERIKESGVKVDFMFRDKPGRSNVKDYIWQAELSIVGKNSSGKYEVLETIFYGFIVENYKVTLMDAGRISSDKFSSFHRDTMIKRKIKF